LILHSYASPTIWNTPHSIPRGGSEAQKIWISIEIVRADSGEGVFRPKDNRWVFEDTRNGVFIVKLVVYRRLGHCLILIKISAEGKKGERIAGRVRRRPRRVFQNLERLEFGWQSSRDGWS
jgi:hypothetical protein